MISSIFKRGKGQEERGREAREVNFISERGQRVSSFLLSWLVAFEPGDWIPWPKASLFWVRIGMQKGKGWDKEQREKNEKENRVRRKKRKQERWAHGKKKNKTRERTKRMIKWKSRTVRKQNWVDLNIIKHLFKSLRGRFFPNRGKKQTWMSIYLCNTAKWYIIVGGTLTCFELIIRTYYSRAEREFCCLVAKLRPTLLRPCGLYIAHQAPLSMRFPRQEYRSGLPFLLQGIFPTQGSNSCLLHWQVYSLPLSHEGSPKRNLEGI